LHLSAGLSDDPETLTKQEIIDAIISARDDLTELPPSSPYTCTNSSECSSDDGNIAGGEETDAANHRRSHPLGSRRHEAHDVAHAPKLAAPQLGRSLSLGHTRILPTAVNCQIETRFVDRSQSRELIS
jgi:mitogen-activated protein kinase kinase kinase 13